MELKKTEMRFEEYIDEPSRRLPVSAEADVLVAGGGIAGVAAALAAARAGARVCLLEKEIALGGLATLGLVTVYLPLCDGMGNQVTYGIAEELLKLAAEDSLEPGIPPAWRDGGSKIDREKSRYLVSFHPASFILALDRLLLNNGVKILFDTRVCDVSLLQDHIQAVVVENKSGRSAVKCRVVVDATGDADICAQAGEPTVSLRTNVLAGWYYAMEDNAHRIKKLTEKFDFYASHNPPGSANLAGDDAEDLTAQVLLSRQKIREHLQEWRKENPDSKIYPTTLPLLPALRMTRRLDNPVKLEEADAGKICSDTVGMLGHWRKKGLVYHLSYRSLTAVKTDNLLVVGRCLSVGQTGWDITRVIPACALSGQAAGAAAALAAREGEAVQKLNVLALQELLKRQHCILA